MGREHDIVQYPLGGPSSLESPMERTVFYLKDFRPFDQRVSLAVRRETHITPSIARLLWPSGPSNIAGLVSSIVVNAVESVAPTGTLANGREECRKGRSPFWTDSDASGAIMTEGMIHGVMASFNHVVPVMIRPCVSHPMLRGSRNANVTIKAPTRFCKPACERAASNGFSFATITFAKPLGFALFSVQRRSTHNKQPAKVLPRKIDEPAHIQNNIMV